MSLTLVSWNVAACAAIPFRSNSVHTRSRLFADALYENIEPNSVDIIGLQECIVNFRGIMKSFVHHPFSTAPVQSSFLSNNIRLLPSGLVILSQWPIVKEAGRIFRTDSYNAEVLLAKGVLYAKIMVKGVYPIHVFNTHLQAWLNARAVDIRMQQCRAIQKFVEEMAIPKDEPVIFMGDWNCDVYEHYATIRGIEHILHATMVPLDGHDYTFDPATNNLVGTDDPSEYKSDLWSNGCTDTIGNGGLCVCCPRQLVDIFFVTNLMPAAMMASVIRPRRPPYVVQTSMYRFMTTRNVSDHHAIVGHLTYDGWNPRVSHTMTQRTVLMADVPDAWWTTLFVLMLLLMSLVSCGYVFRRSVKYS